MLLFILSQTIILSLCSILDVIEQSMEYGYTYIEKVHDLVIDEGYVVNAKEIYDPDVLEEDFQIDPVDAGILKGDNVPLYTKKEIIKFWRNRSRGPCRKLSVVQNRFKRAAPNSVRIAPIK